MTYIKGTTRAQTLFLRAFAKNPYGPPPNEWPSPVILRRWLKRRGFCGAMDSILRALRYQGDFHLTAAAASGAHRLHETVHGVTDGNKSDSGGGETNVAEARRHVESLIHLLRLSHIRARFAEPLPQPEPRGVDVIGFLRTVHPSITVEEALANWDVLSEGPDGRDPSEPGPGYQTWKKTGHPFTPSHWRRWAEEDNHDEDRGDDDDR